MTKNSQSMDSGGNPLVKKYKCPECEKWVRTLQGLSGHIRFKHETSKKEDDVMDQIAEIVELKIHLVAKGHGLGLSTSDIESREQLLDNWSHLVEYCWTFGVKLNAADFKNYVIRSF